MSVNNLTTQGTQLLDVYAKSVNANAVNSSGNIIAGSNFSTSSSYNITVSNGYYALGTDNTQNLYLQNSGTNILQVNNNTTVCNFVSSSQVGNVLVNYAGPGAGLGTAAVAQTGITANSIIMVSIAGGTPYAVSAVPNAGVGFDVYVSFPSGPLSATVDWFIVKL